MPPQNLFKLHPCTDVFLVIISSYSRIIEYVSYLFALQNFSLNDQRVSAILIIATFRTPLHYACMKGHDGITQWLCANRANLGICDEDGKAALMKACLLSLCFSFIRQVHDQLEFLYSMNNKLLLGG